MPRSERLVEQVSKIGEARSSQGDRGSQIEPARASQEQQVALQPNQGSKGRFVDRGMLFEVSQSGFVDRAVLFEHVDRSAGDFEILFGGPGGPVDLPG